MDATDRILGRLEEHKSATDKRLGKIEDKIDLLQNFKWKVIGFSAAIVLIVSGLSVLFELVVSVAAKSGG